jgi:hypothetical protein
MRRRWQTVLLAILMVAILWILIAPNADLDPARPLSLEAFFFVMVAICFLRDKREYLRGLLQCVEARPLDGLSRGGLFSATYIAPLRC